MNKREINRRFDKVFAAMAPPVTAKKKPSSGQASDGGRDAYCSDTQTRPDTSKDGDR
jgi:hypothetical protein